MKRLVLKAYSIDDGQELFTKVYNLPSLPDSSSKRLWQDFGLSLRQTLLECPKACYQLAFNLDFVELTLPF